MKIFVSYPRDESEALAARVFERLAQAFGRYDVIRDVDAFASGAQWLDAIRGGIQQTQVMVVVIGPRWLEALRAAAASAGDYPRLEIEWATQAGVRLVPVLVAGASLPNPAEMPPSIAALAQAQPVIIQNDPMFEYGVQGLIAYLAQLAPSAVQPAPAPFQPPVSQPPAPPLPIAPAPYPSAPLEYAPGQLPASQPPPRRSPSGGVIAAVVAFLVVVVLVFVSIGEGLPGRIFGGHPASGGAGGGSQNTAHGGLSTAPSGQTYCIATDFPVSGTDGSIGWPSEHGADLAAAQATLPNNNTLKIVNFDDAVNGAHNAEQGAQNVTTMVGNSCILAMVGPFNSGVAGAEIPIATAAGMAMISPTNTNPGLTKQQYSQQYGFDYARIHPSGYPNAYFRITTTDDVQGAVDAQLALAAGFQKAYVIDDSESYGKGLADFFTQNFTSGGGTTAGRDSISYSGGSLSYSESPGSLNSLVSKMAATSPDLVFFGGVTSGGGAALRAAMSAGGMASIPMYGGDGIAEDPSFISIAGASAAEGTVATVAAPDPQGLTSSAAQSFSQAFQAKYAAQPISYSFNAYDAANIERQAITDVLNAGQTPTRANVLADIAKISYDGITGHITFDANGDNSGSKVISVYKVTGGQWVYVKQVDG